MPWSTLKIKLHHNYQKVSFSDTIAQSHILYNAGHLVN